MLDLRRWGEGGGERFLVHKAHSIMAEFSEYTLAPAAHPFSARSAQFSSKHSLASPDRHIQTKLHLKNTLSKCIMNNQTYQRLFTPSTMSVMINT